MIKRIEKYIILSASLIISISLSIYGITFIENQLLGGLIGCGLFLLCVVGSFRLIDSLYPKPAELSLDSVKTFFQSKIFWIGFAVLVLNGLFPNLAISAEEQNEIMQMDWTNWVQALMGAGLIIIRKLSKFQTIV